MEQDFEIGIKKHFAEFKKHFDIENNRKILFSAKYGTGKTYFLNKFFSDQEVQKKNNVITISPINYSVSQNEDIFELIKADIIRHFFVNSILTFSKGDISFDKLTVVKQYIKNAAKHPYRIGKKLIYGIAKLGTFGNEVGEYVDSAFDLIEDFEKFEKELNKDYKPAEKILDDYSEDLQNKIGSYLEYNFITMLIKEVLAKTKTKSKKQNVLVIEDFDRLDPAHIFRILNIFSAHEINDQNKFGFDKIIIVCDLGNIESLYRHLYGNRIDFEGYIDKFYSIAPYEFNNIQAIYLYLKNEFKLPIPDYALSVLTDLLYLTGKTESIRLRKFKKTFFLETDDKCIVSYNYKQNFTDYDDVYVPYIDSKIENLEIYAGDIPLIHIVKFLKQMFGGYNQLLRILESLLSSGYKMDAETSKNYAMLLMIPLYLNMDESGYNKLFFKQRDSKSQPEFDALGVHLTVICKWNQSTRYTGGSFYEGSKLIPVGEVVTPLVSQDFVNIIIQFINKGLQMDWFK